MMEYPMPLCIFCRHCHEHNLAARVPSCNAFPDAVPDKIFFESGDHRKPWPGDNGIQFEPRKLTRREKSYLEDVYSIKIKSTKMSDKRPLSEKAWHKITVTDAFVVIVALMPHLLHLLYLCLAIYLLFRIILWLA
ncbi:MAG: hypothetical protein L3J71_07005 [Victivallaceae bacterium]|nr:hypothetical protein [Victivallaceae bacterium]